MDVGRRRRPDESRPAAVPGDAGVPGEASPRGPLRGCRRPGPRVRLGPERQGRRRGERGLSVAARRRRRIRGDARPRQGRLPVDGHRPGHLRRGPLVGGRGAPLWRRALSRGGLFAGPARAAGSRQDSRRRTRQKRPPLRRLLLRPGPLPHRGHPGRPGGRLPRHLGRHHHRPARHHALARLRKVHRRQARRRHHRTPVPRPPQGPLRRRRGPLPRL
mmetsp:Transcript_13246/g.43178  ORF Transcript_13246/g.43178 Transcript_13246/m.43178 type:complete len:217 (+) Transcript_13246:147-797(+)